MGEILETCPHLLTASSWEQSSTMADVRRHRKGRGASCPIGLDYDRNSGFNTNAPALFRFAKANFWAVGDLL